MYVLTVLTVIGPVFWLGGAPARSIPVWSLVRGSGHVGTCSVDRASWAAVSAFIYSQAGLGPLQRLLQRVANRVRRTRQSDETHVAIRISFSTVNTAWDPTGTPSRLTLDSLNVFITYH